jgi:hypothetical protein
LRRLDEMIANHGEGNASAGGNSSDRYSQMRVDIGLRSMPLLNAYNFAEVVDG